MAVKTRSSSNNQDQSLLDMVLENVCCSSDVNSPDAPPPYAGDGSNARDDVTRTKSSRQFSINEVPRQHSRIRNHDFQANASQFSDLQPEVILPHLRFNPLTHLPDHTSLVSSHDRPSTLDDFYNLFLGEVAPHSFAHFHSDGNKDEKVKITPWKEIVGFCGNKEFERIITFQTPISSSSSGNNSNNLGIINGPNADSTSALLLGVTAKQNLCRYDKTLLILESEYSFDFSEVGGRLSNWLVSSECRGTTVVGRVILRECGNGFQKPYNATLFRSPVGKGCLSSNSERDESTDQDGRTTGCLSCFLPPDGLCGTTVLATPETENNTKTSPPPVSLCNSLEVLDDDLDENGLPSRVGALILSAIAAKNGPDKQGKRLVTSQSCSVTPMGVTEGIDENNAQFSKHLSAPTRRRISGEGGEQITNINGDVLSCTSCNVIKLKHIPSFTMQRSSSVNSEGHKAMRRMILDTNQLRRSSGQWQRHGTDAPTSSSHYSPSSHTMPQGLSMRIEMDLRSPASSANSTSSSSFSRSIGSLTSIGVGNIDEKVRKNLKKRVAKTWIAWAESWCMRHWEEEQTDRMAKSTSRITHGRAKVKQNARPTVKRLSKSQSTDSLRGERSRSRSVSPSRRKKSKSPLSQPDSWQRLLVMSPVNGSASRGDAGEKDLHWRFVEAADRCYASGPVNSHDSCEGAAAGPPDDRGEFYEEECGVEVTFSFAPPMDRRDDDADAKLPTHRDNVRKSAKISEEVLHSTKSTGRLFRKSLGRLNRRQT